MPHSLPRPLAALTARRGADVTAAAVLAILATLVAYPRGLQFPFALDDYTYLMPAAGLEPVTGGIRRWLAVRGYYELCLRMFGPQTLGWHLLAYAVHAGNAVWVFVLARKLGASRVQGWIASTLFAASPIAFTVLYWIACIQELGSGFLVLTAAFLLGYSRRPWWSVPAFAAAMLFKESVLVAPLVFVIVFGRRVARIAAVQLAVGIALFVAAGLHARMFDARPEAPYATAYDITVLKNLATQLVWLVSPWRAYPDRIAAPDGAMMLPAALALASVAIIAAVVRGHGLRALTWALLWFAALLAPVLPLRSHTFAYYSYVPQIGLLMLLPAALAGIGTWLSARLRLASPAIAIGLLGMAATGGWIACAARNARLHETLMLRDSEIPHDSVVRSAYVADGIMRSIRDAQLPDSIKRVTVISLPMDVAKVAQTPGQMKPGMVRQRTNPVEMALRDGKLLALHFDGIGGDYRDSLTVADEAADTAIFFASGFRDLTRLPDAGEAYAIQAQGNLLGERREAARHDLEAALRIRPDHAVSRVLLAGLEAESAHFDRARTLIQGVDPSTIPAQLRPYLTRIQSLLSSAP